MLPIYLIPKNLDSLPEKLKNLICEIPVIQPTLNINNLGTTSATSINLDITRKLIFKKYSLKHVR